MELLAGGDYGIAQGCTARVLLLVGLLAAAGLAVHLVVVFGARWMGYRAIDTRQVALVSVLAPAGIGAMMLVGTLTTPGFVALSLGGGMLDYRYCQGLSERRERLALGSLVSARPSSERLRGTGRSPDGIEVFRVELVFDGRAAPVTIPVDTAEEGARLARQLEAAAAAARR